MFRRNTAPAQAVRPDLALAVCDAAVTNVAIAAQFADLAGGAPEWVQLLPLGDIRALDGREWRNADPKAVLAATRAIGRDLPVDYDHAIDSVKERGGAAPAAGWIKQVELRADGIYGRVEWTERAKAALAAKEWRFISPVFQFDKNSRDVLRLLRAALTNDPAIAELRAVAHRSSNEDTMDKELVKQLAKMLGLAETATEAEVRTAIAAAQANPLEAAIAVAAASTALAPVAKALGLAETAKPEEVTAAIATALAAAKNPDPAKFAPIAVVTELQGRMTALEEKQTTATATAAVEAAMTAGKITPAMKDWALDLARSNPKKFEEFVGKQPTIVASGRTVADLPKGDSPLSPEEKAVCSALGFTEEQWKKTREAKEAA